MTDALFYIWGIISLFILVAWVLVDDHHKVSKYIANMFIWHWLYHKVFIFVILIVFDLKFWMGFCLGLFGMILIIR